MFSGFSGFLACWVQGPGRGGALGVGGKLRKVRKPMKNRCFFPKRFENLIFVMISELFGKKHWFFICFRDFRLFWLTGSRDLGAVRPKGCKDSRKLYFRFDFGAFLKETLVFHMFSRFSGVWAYCLQGCGRGQPQGKAKNTLRTV